MLPPSEGPIMPRRSLPTFTFVIVLVALTWACGETGQGAESEPTAPPAGHCDQLCNRLDEVNKELQCDVDTVGLGETHEVDVPGCIAKCNEPKVCMDKIVAYDQCRLALMADQFSCDSRRENDPLTTECTDEFDAAFDCQADNL